LIGKFQVNEFFLLYGMKIKWDRLLGEIAGLVFVVVLIKMFMATDVRWWKIAEVIIRGLMGLGIK
jgi:hypothetical protein